MQERSMANQNAFTAEEWALVRLAPSFVASGTSASDRGCVETLLAMVVIGGVGCAN
jgi:hypothetical protein